MGDSKLKRVARIRRKQRIRRKSKGTDARPRLAVFRSNRAIYVQVISDQSGRTLASASSQADKGALTVDVARQVGGNIAEKCKKAGIDNVVMDRAGYKFHGRVKALADAAREAGLKL